MSRGGRTAFGGIGTALTVIVLLLNGYTYPKLQFILPMAAGFIIYALSFVIGKRYAAAAYLASTVLAWILCATRMPVLYYTLFFGYYPILNELSERLPGKIIAYILRIIYFNIVGAVVLSVCRLVFHTDIIPEGISGINAVWIILIGANILFVIYDLTVYFFRKQYRQIITDFVRKQIGNKK